MKTNHNVMKLFVLIGILALPFSTISAQAAAIAQDNKIEGVVLSRDGDNLVMRADTGSVTNVTLTKSTKFDALKGLLGVRSDNADSSALVPGLRITVEPESPGKTSTVAKSVQFHVNDLETANDIQGALTVPQQQIKVLIEQAMQQGQQIAALQKELGAQKQELAAQKQQNDAQDQAMAARKAEVDKRFGDLADYDVKGEMTVLFEVNSADLSDSAKAELTTFAAKAKTLKGYLVQVAGFTDSTGSANANQNLSDRRAANVASFLRQSCDLGMSRVLAPVAMSTAKPVAPNETAKGKAENHRVMVKVAVNRGIAQQ